MTVNIKKLFLYEGALLLVKWELCNPMNLRLSPYGGWKRAKTTKVEEK